MATTHESALSQKLEDPFQLPLDFSENGYVSLEDFGISSLFDDIPITQMEREMEAFLPHLTYSYDHLYSLSIEPNQFQLPPLQDFNDDVYCNGLGNNEKKQPLPSGESDNNMSGGSKMVVTREMLSKYFYMPITKAARELNVGLTILKKRCRELGIGRWPHRKLKSLNALITNIEEGEESEETKRELIQELERERRMIEEMPDAQMQKQTKRLRQSCFKDNYRKRKRKRMSMPIADHHQPSTSTSTCSCTTSSAENIEPTYYGSSQEYEELRSLLSCPEFMF